MDEICATLSERLYTGGQAKYSVFYEEELLDALPDDARNAKALQDALHLLADGGYIDIKYARGNAFCIAPLKKFVVPQAPCKIEPERIAEENNPTKKGVGRAIFAAVCAFTASFLGGLAGALLGAVIC